MRKNDKPRRSLIELSNDIDALTKKLSSNVVKLQTECQTFSDLLRSLFIPPKK